MRQRRRCQCRVKGIAAAARGACLLQRPQQSLCCGVRSGQQAPQASVGIRSASRLPPEAIDDARGQDEVSWPLLAVLLLVLVDRSSLHVCPCVCVGCLVVHALAARGERFRLQASLRRRKDRRV
jgi:hypothetical protein